MLDSPVQEIKDRLPILDLVQDYVQLKKAGTNYKGLCPFHGEKTPSFMVSPSKQIWHCFGCGLGGDIFEFIKLSENVEFAEALRILAHRAGVELKKLTPAEAQTVKSKDILFEINKQAANYFEKVLWESESARSALEYLKNRGLTDQTIRNWQLGFAPDDFHYLENFLAKSFKKEDIAAAGLIIKSDRGDYFDRFRGRVMFPIHNMHGQVVGFTGRLLHEKDGVGKYMNSPETPIYSKSRELFGLHQAKNLIRKENRAVVVEGNMDVITCHQSGFTQTVASSGTALTEPQLMILSRFCENLIFAFDADSAGAMATRRALELALNFNFNVKIVKLTEAKDPDELVRRSPGLWQKAMDGAVNFVEFFFDAAFQRLDSQTVEGKREITKDLLPLVTRVRDNIAKAHFVRKLSERLNIAEKAIWDTLEKISSPRPPVTPFVPVTPLTKKSRREILEERLLGLVLRTGESQSLVNFQDSDFHTTRSQVFQLLKAGDVHLDRLKSSHPDLAGLLDLLDFAVRAQVEEQDLDPKIELKQTAHEFGKLIVKDRMERIGQDLKLAEAKKDKDQISKLSEEYVALSKRMNQFQS